MTDDQAQRLEDKLDRITPIIEALGAILVRQQVASERTGIHKNTLSKLPGYEESTKRKAYIEIGEIATVKRRKGTGKKVT